MTTEDTVLVLNLNPSPDAAFHFGNHSDKMAIAKALVDKQIAGQPGIEIETGKYVCFRFESNVNNSQVKIPPTKSINSNELTQKLTASWKIGHKTDLEIRHDFNLEDYEAIGISSKHKNCVVSLAVYRWLKKKMVHASLSVDFQNTNNKLSDLAASLKLLEEMSNLTQQTLGKMGLPLPCFSLDLTSSKISLPERE